MPPSVWCTSAQVKPNITICPIQLPNTACTMAKYASDVAAAESHHTSSSVPA